MGGDNRLVSQTVVLAGGAQAIFFELASCEQTSDTRNGLLIDRLYVGLINVSGEERRAPVGVNKLQLVVEWRAEF